MDEILNYCLNKFFNKILELYRIHNVRLREDFLRYEVKNELRNQMLEKINDNFINKIQGVYITMSRLHLGIIKKDDYTEEEVKNNISIFESFERKLDNMYENIDFRISRLSYSDEFKNVLNYIYKHDLVYDYELRRDLDRLFFQYQEVISHIIKSQIKKEIDLKREEIDKKVQEAKKYLERQKDNFQNDELNVKEELKKIVDEFVKEREEQRKRDSVEREKQLSSFKTTEEHNEVDDAVIKKGR